MAIPLIYLGYVAGAALITGGYLAMPSIGNPRKTNAQVMGEGLVDGAEAIGEGLEATGEAIGGVFSSSAENAEQTAETELESGTQVEACSTCPPPPGCNDLNDQISRLRNELEERRRDMQIDRYDLFNRAFSRSNPLIVDGVRIGSWEGHVDQFRQKQTALRNRVARARSMGCSINTPDADRWGSIDAPSRPSPSFD